MSIKQLKWASSCIFAAAAFALPIAAMAAPTATAVWRNNFGQIYTVGGNAYALEIPANANKASAILNQDGTVTVTNDWTGLSAPYFDLSSVKPTSVSILVKFSGLSVPTTGSYGFCLANMRDSGGNDVGSYVHPGMNALCAYYMEPSTNQPNQQIKLTGSENAVVESGYMLFSYSTTGGVKSYMGSAIDGLVGGEKDNYKYRNRTISQLSIGGDAGKYYNPCGFTIEEVALFVGTQLTASDIADYVFPTVTKDDAASMTMTELNAKVAALASGAILSFTAANPVVTCDVVGNESPSDATKAYLRGGVWRGTVSIKDQEINNLDPTIYGNPKSTLRLSGVSGYWKNGVFANTAVPAIELVDSETTNREYGYYASNGYSFYSGNYNYVHTPELKGSGTYKANNSGSGALLVVDKWDNFTGKIELEGKTVWFGTGAPAHNTDTWNNLVNKPGTVRLGSSIPANYATWIVPNGYHGTVVMTTAVNATETAFLTASSWKGTCLLNWNATGKLDIVNYGNANSVIEIPSTFSALPTRNGGNNSANVAAEVKVTGNWTVSDGWDNQTTTFAKLSGAGTLTVNGTTSSSTALPYTITRLEGFTGTLAGARGKFTIGTIVSSVEPTAGTKLVNCTTTNAPVIDDTVVIYNNETADVDLEVKADGIYVAEAEPAAPAARIGETTYTTVIEALGVAYGTGAPGTVVVVLDETFQWDASYNEYFSWDSDARTATRITNTDSANNVIADSAEAAIALVVGTKARPAAVEAYVSAEAYAGYFTKTATQNGNGTWSVSSTLDKEAVFSGEATETATLEALLADALDSNADAITLPAKNGLYYSIAAGTDLTTDLTEGTRVLATGGSVTLTKPAGNFFKVHVNTTAE